jgi:putative nucleotidyltransferase with HDIG domain
MGNVVEKQEVVSSVEELGRNREAAFTLLKQYTKNEALIKHALSVEAAMRWYAAHYQEDEEKWAVTGLLHDFDYEQYPNCEEGGHPYKGCEILREAGYPEDTIEAILGHAQFTNVARETLMAKALFACDELCGLVTASVLVRPDKSLMSLKAKSVKKKMKDKAFAKGVNRDDIRLGVEELGIALDDHITNVITGMQASADALGLAGES